MTTVRTPAPRGLPPVPATYNSLVRAAALLVMALGVAGAAFGQVDPKTALLEQEGFTALNAGQTERAADAFRAALTADPRNARLHLGAGVAAWLQHLDLQAKTELERALDLDPRQDEARRFLGLVDYRMGDIGAAIAVYETLVAHQPGVQEPTATLDRWRRERDLQSRMRTAVGNHFIVSFEGPAEAELADKALESLDRAYWRIGQALGVYPANPVAVVLYTGEQFRDITRSPPWAAGAYDGTIRVPMRGALGRDAELDRVLAHEFTHALVRGFGARPIPTWLNEGLATALEADDLSWAESRLARVARPPSVTVLAGSFGRLSGADAEVAYASSAVAVARLLDTAGGIAVANLVRDLAGGTDFEAAFARRMPWMFADFAASLIR